MKALAIILLTILGFWLITVGLGILSVGCAAVAWWIIKQDRNGAAIEGFMGWCFALAVIGGLFWLMGF